MNKSISILEPPKFCQCSESSCDQKFDSLSENSAFFAYPSEPNHLSATIRECVKSLQSYSTNQNWLSWENFKGGHIIFCEICKAIRFSNLIVADITTMNFNVLFELGFAIGLHKPVLPIRDKTYQRDNQLLNDIGIFDTLGYKNFENSKELMKLVTSHVNNPPVLSQNYEINYLQPIYYVKSPIENDGSVKLTSLIKKSPYRFRTYDPKEFTRLSLHDAYKQTTSSVSVIAHLIDPERNGAISHNARAAFVCGMALAIGKNVLMLQEGNNLQPIDYRDLILPYSDVNIISTYIEKFVKSTADTIQSFEKSTISLPTNLLERIDIGDVAAENEIQALSSYFVKTPQYQQIRQGHARIVVGRKGSGKSALFYGIREQILNRKDFLVLDLKPEGHQFSRLRDELLKRLSTGLQEHTLTAFWHYLLLIEILTKIVKREAKNAYRDSDTLQHYRELEDLYKKHSKFGIDFSERLMGLVNRLIESFPNKENEQLNTSDLTNAIYSADIEPLIKAVSLSLKNTSLWMLFDNIDKGFPSHGITAEDALIVRCLLDATRKIHKTGERDKVGSNATIFIRRDVYDYLIDQTPDRGKESTVSLDWSDMELIKELLLKRFLHEVPDLPNDFEKVWGTIFDTQIKGESTFRYITNRTFLRPRDILNFVRKCIQVGVSRGHSRVEQDDIITAEKEFSEDMFNELKYEVRDVFPELPDILPSFIGASETISKDEIAIRLLNTGIEESKVDSIIDLLLWFSFLGISSNEAELYSYKMQYNLSKLKALITNVKDGDNVYSLHPAFRHALSLDL